MEVHMADKILVGISADTADDFRRIKTRLLADLTKGSDIEPFLVRPNVSANADHAYRFSGYFDSREALERSLTKDASKDISQEERSTPDKIVWLFPGSGVQYPGMGRELYLSFATFRTAVDRCSAMIQSFGGFDPRILYLASREDKDLGEFVLPPSRSGIAVFVYQYAMTELLKSFGHEPDIVVGHSLGEYAAAVAASALDLEGGLRVMHDRGVLLEGLPDPGAMLVIHATEDQISERLTSGLTVSAYNSLSSINVAGPVREILELHLQLSELGITSHRIRYGAASHCAIVEPILKDFEASISRARLDRARLDWYSTLSGLRQNDPTPHYWRKQFRDPVQFAATIAHISSESVCNFLEIGPQNGLSALIASTPGQHRTVSVGQHARDKTSEVDTLVRGISTLWALGAQADLSIVADCLQARTRLQSQAPPPQFAKANEPGVDALASLIAKVWRQYLGDDEFENKDFYESGGHSLLAVRMASELSTLFQLSVPPTVVLANPTISSLVAAVMGLGTQSQVDVRTIASIWNDVLEQDDEANDSHSVNAPMTLARPCTED